MARPMSLVGEIEALKASLLSDFDKQKAELKAEIADLKAQLLPPVQPEMTEAEKAEQLAIEEARMTPGEKEERRLREERHRAFHEVKPIDLDASYHPQEIGTLDGRDFHPDGRVIYFTRLSNGPFYRFRIELNGEVTELPAQLDCDWTNWSSLIKALQDWLTPQGLTMRMKSVPKDTHDISYLFGSKPGTMRSVF